jgi:hypothetical protein
LRFALEFPVSSNNKEDGGNLMSNTFSTDFAGRNFSLKTNYVAAQADGSILVYYGSCIGNGGIFKNCQRRG